jgi:2-methylcitrate dehydratase PrpD
VAVRLGLLRAGGLRAAFGSDGKALQVALAAADGVMAARMAAAGATASPGIADGPAGFAQAFGAGPAPAGDARAVEQNWIKPWPCCLMAHSAIEAALDARAQGLPADAAVAVIVHPRARAAAAYDDIADGLQAKFSIPYLVAYALTRREPTVESFDAVDPEVRDAARRVEVRTDPALAEPEAVLEAEGRTVARVVTSLGSPGAPLTEAQLEAKVRSLAGGRLDGVLDDPARPAADVLAAAGLA